MDSSKRKFLKSMVFVVNGTIGVLLGVPIVGYLLDPLFRQFQSQWIEAGPVADFNAEAPKRVKLAYKVASGVKETHVEQNVWILAEGDQFAAFSQVCTHASCNVNWEGKEKVFACPCHGGKFDKAGKVIDGPPPLPLHRFSTKVENGKVMIEV